MKNKNEGTCGHGPGGKLGKTPGGTKGMPAYKRTNDMLRKFIREELKNITEHHKDEDFPEQEKPVNDLLDSLADKDKGLYKRLEKFIQKSIQQEIAKLKEDKFIGKDAVPDIQKDKGFQNLPSDEKTAAIKDLQTGKSVNV